MANGIAPTLSTLQCGLIVSCQAPVDSPLHRADVIAAMAEAAILRGAVGVRIDTPAHIRSVRQQISQPIIGLWKCAFPESSVYITPQFIQAQAIAQAGADVIALDATLRSRPSHETVLELIDRIHTQLQKPVLADVDTLDAAIAAANLGADCVSTTLYGYTEITRTCHPPNLELLSQMVEALSIPVICEGGIQTPAIACEALARGAFAVVVGTAITGIDAQVQAYQRAIAQSRKQAIIE